mmetsp:Transcript_21255/g.35143  ORF Transcript_21255/g.35143 Transcript_21255/m.35143 type:complete len:80 (+) Transcript_21255:200-439(+)
MIKVDMPALDEEDKGLLTPSKYFSSQFIQRVFSPLISQLFVGLFLLRKRGGHPFFFLHIDCFLFLNFFLNQPTAQIYVL